MTHQLPALLYHCQDKGYFYKIYSKYPSVSPLALFQRNAERTLCVCVGTEVVTPL